MGGSGTPCEQRGCLAPSPYPHPWTWRGPVAGRWSAQDGPRWLQEGLRALKMASKIAQDSPTWLQLAHNMRPRGPSTAPIRLQVAKRLSKEALEKPESFKHIKNNVFRLLAFSLPGLKMALRWPKTAPKEAQEWPKTAPRAPKSAPRRFFGPERGNAN